MKFIIKQILSYINGYEFISPEVNIKTRENSGQKVSEETQRSIDSMGNGLAMIISVDSHFSVSQQIVISSKLRLEKLFMLSKIYLR